MVDRWSGSLFMQKRLYLNCWFELGPASRCPCVKSDVLQNSARFHAQESTVERSRVRVLKDVTKVATAIFTSTADPNNILFRSQLVLELYSMFWGLQAQGRNLQAKSYIS